MSTTERDYRVMQNRIVVDMMVELSRRIHARDGRYGVDPETLRIVRDRLCNLQESLRAEDAKVLARHVW